MVFEPGMSGNPDGRPKKPRIKTPSDRDVEDYCQRQLLKTLRKLVVLRDDPNTSPDVILKVCCKILDKTYDIRVNRLELEKELRSKPKDPAKSKNSANGEKVKPLFSAKAIQN